MDGESLDDYNDEASTDESGSSSWGSDSEDSNGNSISLSLNGAQCQCMLYVLFVELHQSVCQRLWSLTLLAHEAPALAQAP